MSTTDIQEIQVEHYVSFGDGAKIVCTHLNGSGRTKVFRLYPDGLVEAYEGGRFVQLPVAQARLLKRRLQQQEGNTVPCFRTSGISFTN